MNERLQRLAAIAIIATACAGLSGCLVESAVGKLAKVPGGYQMEFELDVDSGYCDENGDISPVMTATHVFDCEYAGFDGPGRAARVLIQTGLDLLFLEFVDPLIVQVRDDATGISGTYDNGLGVSGPLVITAGLKSVPIDMNNDLVAEAARQIVIVELPPGVPAGKYRLTFNATAATPNFKALFAGKVQTAGKTYYPPLLPCVASFANVPAISFPAPDTPAAPILTSAFIAQVQGCDRKVYTFPGGGPAIASVVEFYNAALDHYFITWIPSEIAKLDAGTQIKGWQRTTKTFKAYPVAQPGTSQVCRFYIPPGLGDSHFFGRGKMECDDTAAKFPSLVLEDPMYVYMILPTAGICPAATTPVYRVFSNRADANHRYTTDRAVRQSMVDKGWLAEGDGPDLVVMCAPT